LLVLHQLALTLIHFVLGPMAGLDPRSAVLTATTIIGAAVILGLVVLRDIRRSGRAGAVLLVAPVWNRSTVLTMLAGILIAQIPLFILAAQGATVWQAGQSSSLAVGRALLASLTGPGGTLLILATVLVAPVIEETLYRGYLAGTVMVRSSATLAVIVSALLFVTLHMEVANLVASLCLGIGTAICAVRTRSILPGLVVHVASNAFGMWYATLA